MHIFYGRKRIIIWYETFLADNVIRFFWNGYVVMVVFIR